MTFALTTALSALAAAIIGMAAVPKLLPPASPKGIEAGPLRISPDGYALIVEFEVGGGQAYYDRHLAKPTWPGGESGVTIGIGYDLGYNTRAQIAADWKALGAERVALLQSVAGIKGTAAKLALSRVRSSIVVPWSLAQQVYQERTMPRFGKQTAEAFNGAKDAHPHLQGSLLSIVFNRGPGMGSEKGRSDTDSRAEMRAIRTHLMMGETKHIPGDIRSMKRLWVGKSVGPGLIRRREAEALLAEKSLQYLR